MSQTVNHEKTTKQRPALNLPIPRPVKTLLPYIIAGAIILLLPMFIPSFVQSLVTKIMIFSIFGVSMNILWGYAGIPTFGHAAFFGVGGYSVGILIKHVGITDFWLASLLAVLITAFIAAILGIPAFRVYGVGASANPIYFLLVTIAFGELLSRVAIFWRPVTGGNTGLSAIPLPKLDIPGINITQHNYYYLVFIFMVICLFLIYRLINSHYGYALRGIHDNERRMQTLGYNTWLYKYSAYIIAGLFGGVSGVLFAFYGGNMSPANLGMAQTDVVFLIVILGGCTTFFGPVLGSVVILSIEYLSSLYMPDRWPLILGGIFVVAIIFIPNGLSVLLLKYWRKLSHGLAKG
jgi:branched-chain amino acid transport system permease protein